MTPREKATAFILKWIGELTPGDATNVTLMKERLGAMSDKVFAEYMARLAKGGDPVEGEILPLTAPNLSKIKLTVENNLRVANALGTKIWQRVWYTDPVTGQEVLSRHPAMIVYLPVRRQAQTQVKKESVPLDSRVRDDMSGQVTGDSKGGKLSFPEIQTLAGQGTDSVNLDAAVLEMIKLRGGDEVAEREMNRQLLATGQANFKQLVSLGTRPKSVETMEVLFKSMHLDINL